jgi:hypothetical protein
MWNHVVDCMTHPEPGYRKAWQTTSRIGRRVQSGNLSLDISLVLAYETKDSDGIAGESVVHEGVRALANVQALVPRCDERPILSLGTVRDARICANSNIIVPGGPSKTKSCYQLICRL